METVQRDWRWLLGIGIVLSVLGVLLIGVPVLGTLAVDLLIGWLLIIGAAAQLIHAFKAKGSSSFVFELLSGVLYGVVGILLVFFPLAGAHALTVLLAIFLTIEGLVRIGMALQMRPAQGWGWVLFGGIVTLVLAVLIWTQMPGSALWVIGLLVGINLLFTGWSLCMVAIATRAKST